MGFSSYGGSDSVNASFQADALGGGGGLGGGNLLGWIEEQQNAKNKREDMLREQQRQEAAKAQAAADKKAETERYRNDMQRRGYENARRMHIQTSGHLPDYAGAMYSMDPNDYMAGSLASERG